MALKRALSMKINGVEWQGFVESSWTLLDFLREQMNLTGTKRGCDMGDCGCCTVHLNDQPALSCLIPVLAADGGSVNTIEGIARGGELHPLQEAMVEAGAIQCGFCTPAMVMNGVHLLATNSSPTDQQIKEAISGTICRCTGYTKIEAAVRLAASKQNECQCQGGGQCKKAGRGNCHHDHDHDHDHEEHEVPR